MDVVYPLGTGSIYNNLELRISLRSLSRLSGIENVYIIGERPDWLQNAVHVHAVDSKGNVPDLNIMRKIEIACRMPEVSENFLFMNDDHYIQHRFHVEQFPNYYTTEMAEYLRRRPGDGYHHRVKNSYDHLVTLGLPTKYFDCHYPIVYSKAAFLEHVVEKLDWKRSKHGFVIKSVYANAMNLEGTKTQDYKSGVAHPPCKAPVFSSNPNMRIGYQRMLTEKFPQKSIFER